MDSKDLTKIGLLVIASIMIFAFVSTAITLYSINSIVDSGLIEKKIVSGLSTGLAGLEIDCNSGYMPNALKINFDGSALYCTAGER